MRSIVKTKWRYAYFILDEDDEFPIEDDEDDDDEFEDGDHSQDMCGSFPDNGNTRTSLKAKVGRFLLVCHFVKCSVNVSVANKNP